jgi:hypothetical protein
MAARKVQADHCSGLAATGHLQWPLSRITGLGHKLEVANGNGLVNGRVNEEQSEDAEDDSHDSGSASVSRVGQPSHGGASNYGSEGWGFRIPPRVTPKPDRLTDSPALSVTPSVGQRGLV